MSPPSLAPAGRSPRLAAGGIVSHEAVRHPAWAKAQAEVLWQALSALGFDAVGLGSTELELVDSDREQAELGILLGTTQLVASNLVELGPDGAETPPSWLTPVWRGPGVSMLSFLPHDLSGTWLHVDEEGKTLPAARWKTLPVGAALDRLVRAGRWSNQSPTLAFFEGTQEAAHVLAGRLSPESFVLLVADEFEATERIDVVGAQVIHIGSRLRQSLRLSGGPDLEVRQRLHQQRVLEDVPGDASVGYLRGLFRIMLQAYDARAAVADSGPAAAHGGYAGSNSCTGCHEEAAAIWQETLHHQAWETLELDERDGVPASFDPRCVACHSVGYGTPGGFGSVENAPETRWAQASPLAGVGCESCHGPGAEHIRSEAKDDIERGGEYTCLQCHDAENDPGFHFEDRWADISHLESDL
jgi:hypothetical protein